MRVLQFKTAAPSNIFKVVLTYPRVPVPSLII